MSKHNQPNKYKPVDVINDIEMVQEGLRHPLLRPRYDFSKTKSEQDALKRVKNRYNAQMRIQFGDKWSKKRAHRNETGNINVPMTRNDDGTFRINHSKTKAA